MSAPRAPSFHPEQPVSNTVRPAACTPEGTSRCQETPQRAGHGGAHLESRPLELRQEGLGKLEAQLGYLVSSRPACVTQTAHLKNKRTKEKQRKETSKEGRKMQQPAWDEPPAAPGQGSAQEAREPVTSSTAARRGHLCQCHRHISDLENTSCLNPVTHQSRGSGQVQDAVITASDPCLRKVAKGRQTHRSKRSGTKAGGNCGCMDKSTPSGTQNPRTREGRLPPSQASGLLRPPPHTAAPSFRASWHGHQSQQTHQSACKAGRRPQRTSRRPGGLEKWGAHKTGVCRSGFPGHACRPGDLSLCSEAPPVAPHCTCPAG